MVQPLPGKYPATEPLKLYRGDYRALRVTVFEDDGVTPRDLTGHTFLSQVRGTADGSVQATWTITVDDDPTTGIITLELPKAQAETLVPGSAVWDVQITDADGKPQTPIANKVKVVADVSRAS